MVSQRFGLWVVQFPHAHEDRSGQNKSPENGAFLAIDIFYQEFLHPQNESLPAVVLMVRAVCLSLRRFGGVLVKNLVRRQNPRHFFGAGEIPLTRSAIGLQKKGEFDD
jgi:hypothetical protein